jgi:hypothetical protein
MKKITVLVLGLAILVYAKAAAAICPLCAVAVAGGVGLSRWLGLDDAITGLWVGGLIVSLIMWTIDWLEQKNWRWPGYRLTTVLAYYLLTVVPLAWLKVFGRPLRVLAFAHVDKLLLGIVVGSAVFWATAEWHFFLKAKHDNKVYFPFQKVALPVGALLIVNLLFYWIIK